ncbi:O-antigen ligase family protein [Microbacterium aerolatum]|uniref:O-antigen ligase family protein n=1 Tax=Microbacterium aerolatum TaxID=153731 RepID=UPI002000B175|nr:O-antigen ligase family protein [Microbacterium aerolatum]MCK3769981.1 O-antigen ligase family protein [Microbacterium aerolatum]
MSVNVAVPSPIPAVAHRGMRQSGVSAVTMLTIYLVLLVGFPSNMAISALGAYGRPQFLWGIVLFIWWVFSQLQVQRRTVEMIGQPVRIALGVFLMIALVGFAVALLRGQPSDQVSPAISAILRFVSWTGVMLVAIDGIRSMTELLTIVRRIVIACALLAMLGIVQFISGQSFLEVFSGIPGLSESAGGIDTRGMFLRSSGTATHPLEYGTALSIAVPLALAVAILRVGHRHESRRLRWWIFLAALAMASFLAVSRSTLIGFAVAVTLMIPALPRRYRALIIVGGAVLAVVVVIATPGLYGTILGMFLGVGNDSSTQSRQAGMALAPVFLSASPFVGVGVGTLLPRYFIFDNQWLGILIETGILGTLAFAAIFVTAIWSAAAAAHRSQRDDIRLMGRALAASTAVAGLLLAFFDGLAFPIAAGLMFLVFGLCGAIRTVSWAESRGAMIAPSTLQWAGSGDGRTAAFAGPKRASSAVR